MVCIDFDRRHPGSKHNFHLGPREGFELGSNWRVAATGGSGAEGMEQFRLALEAVRIRHPVLD